MAVSDEQAGLAQEPDGTLTSDSLAELIIDALIDHGLVERKRFEEAVRIAASEINVRKSLGDY